MFTRIRTLASTLKRTLTYTRTLPVGTDVHVPTGERPDDSGRVRAYLGRGMVAVAYSDGSLHTLALADLRRLTPTQAYGMRRRYAATQANAAGQLAATAAFADMARQHGGTLGDAAAVHDALLDIGADATLTRRAYVAYLQHLGESMLADIRTGTYPSGHPQAYHQVLQVLSRIA